MNSQEVTALLNNQLFIAICSATISALIGYIVGLRKERMILRQNLETETVDTLLNLIADASDRCSGIHSMTTFFILPFNSYYKGFEPDMKCVSDMWLSLATSEVDKLFKSYLDYHYTAIKAIRFTENRCIILNKGFKVYTDETIKRHTKLREDANFLTEELCRFNIINKMERVQELSMSDLESIEQAIETIREDRVLVQIPTKNPMISL